MNHLCLLRAPSARPPRGHPLPQAGEFEVQLPQAWARGRVPAEEQGEAQPEAVREPLPRVEAVPEAGAKRPSPQELERWRPLPHPTPARASSAWR